MRNCYKLKRKCSICGTRIIDHNKSGLCNKHRDRTGANNSFYHKSHTEETKQKLRNSCCIASKNMWKNKEYRNKVIKGISKPRREEFKQEQSARIKQWYKAHPEQKELRAKQMKKNWKDGKIVQTHKPSARTSKIEKEFFDSIKKHLPVEEKQTIHINNKWFFPDCLIVKNKIIIEFYGNFWHGNPNMMTREEKVLNKTVKEIWKTDKKRIKQLEKQGYTVYVVWEADYKKNKEQTVQTCVDNIRFDWDSCSE